MTTETFGFRNLPVENVGDVTENFEQLAVLLLTQWTPLTLGAKFENFGGFQAAGYRPELNALRLRGVLKVKAGETYALAETVFTLPEGSRPPGDVDLTTSCKSNVGSTTGVLKVKANGVGELVVINSGANIPAGEYLTLDGLTFNLS